MRIAIDWDITTVPSDRHWMNWLKTVSGKPIKRGLDVLFKDYPYDLSELFDMPEGISGKSWWKNPNLYDDIFPYDDAIETINKFHEEGHEIIFVSSIKHDHAKSKYRSMMRHFPYAKGVLFTHEKFLVDCDVAIDDRIDVLNKFSDNVQRICITTPYEQFEEPNEGIMFCSSWEEIGDVILGGECE